MDRIRPWADKMREVRRFGDNAKIGEETLRQRNLIINLIIPFLKGKKYHVTRKMVNLLTKAHINNKDGVSNFLLAKCLGIKFNEKNPKLTKKRYKDKEKMQEYNDKIQNCFRTIKRAWRPKGYGVQFNKDKSKIVKIDTT